MVAFVILNYKDYDGCIQTCEEALKNEIVNNVIIVDNCSNDGSFEKLSKHYIDKANVYVLQSKYNGGYSSGYNLGFRYAKKLGADYAFLCNTDVIINTELLYECIQYLKSNEKCGAVSGKMHDKMGNEQLSAWNFPEYWNDVLFCFRNLRKKVLPRRIDYIQETGDLQTVDSLAGSFTCYRIKALESAGYYDENIFLYNEENAIGKRLRSVGYSLVRLNNIYYIHAHKKSRSEKLPLKFLIKRASSAVYLHKTYNKVVTWKVILLEICIRLGAIEEWIIMRLKK